MSAFAYILECKDETFYIGSTNDLDRRLHAHNNLKSGAHYTKIRRPVVLRYFETFRTLGQAKKREAQIKKLNRDQKSILIKNFKRCPKKF